MLAAAGRTARVFVWIIDTISEGTVSGDGEAEDVVSKLAGYRKEIRRLDSDWDGNAAVMRRPNYLSN